MEKVTITSGEYKSYEASIKKVNYNKAKVNITFKSCSIPTEGIKIISDKKALVPLAFFQGIELDMTEIYKSIEKITKLNFTSYNNTFSYNEELSENIINKLEELGLKHNPSLNFLTIKHLLVKYKLEGDKINIYDFTGNIKIKTSFLEVRR